METVWSNLDREYGFFSSDERRWHTRIHRLKEQFPDEVTILAEPEENDGCIYAKVPYDWLKIGPKRRVNLTDEEKAILAEKLRSHQKSSSDSGEDERPDFDEDEGEWR